MLSEPRLWIVADNGPGLDSDDVPRLFCVNRPLLSSKLKRMPTRGMLGNGLRVVMAWAQAVFVTSRGVFQRLEVDQTTGRTIVTHRDNVPMEPGMTVEVRAEDPDHACFAKKTIGLAKIAHDYSGPSNPHWYGYSDFARLFSDAPASASAADVVADLGLPSTQKPDRTRAGSHLCRRLHTAARTEATNATCATRQNRPARTHLSGQTRIQTSAAASVANPPAATCHT